MRKRRSVRAVATWGGLCLLVVCVALLADVLGPVQGQGQAAPKYKFDPDWPKPLPNKWKLGGVTGLAVDKDDNVWVLDRPNDLTSIELEAELNPPIADCCVGIDTSVVRTVSRLSSSPIDVSLTLNK